MADIKKWIIDNNRYTTLVLSIVFSILVVMVAFYVPLGVYGSLLLYVGPPLVTFMTMHYTRFYRLKLRLLASPLIFLIVLIVSAILLSHAYYAVDHPESAQLSNGTHLFSTVTPFKGQASSYNFTLYASNNSDPSNFTTTLQIVGPSTNITLTYSELGHYVAQNGTVVVYYAVPASSLPDGVFSYNYTINNGYAYLVGNGPIKGGEAVVISDITPVFVIQYIIPHEMIFLLGVFLARSISHSRSYDRTAEESKKK